MEILVIGCIVAIGLVIAWFFWQRRIVTVTTVTKLQTLKEGTRVKLIGKISATNKAITKDLVGHALQQFRGSSGWQTVRQRCGPLEITLQDGTAQVTNDNYVIQAQEPLWFSSQRTTERDGQGRETANETLQGPQGKYVAQWESEYGQGTLRRAAVARNDAVVIHGRVASAGGNTIIADQLPIPARWEWVNNNNTVPVATMAELRAVPLGTAVVFYATVSSKNPSLVESFVLADEYEYSVGPKGEPAWNLVKQWNEPLTVEIPGGSFRLLESRYEFSLQTFSTIEGSFSEQTESTETEAGTSYRFTVQRNGQTEIAEYDALTKRGSRRYRGIEAGDQILIVGNLQNGPDGLSVSPKQVFAFREGLGLFKSRSCAPPDEEKMHDLM